MRLHHLFHLISTGHLSTPKTLHPGWGGAFAAATAVRASSRPLAFAHPFPHYAFEISRQPGLERTRGEA